MRMDSRAVSVAEMRAIEENAQHLGVDRLLLMENAGREVAKSAAANLRGHRNSVLLVTYAGNKAGDAFVAARHLAGYGAAVEILALTSPDEIKTEEARINWKIIKNMEESVEVQFANQASEVREFFAKSTPSVIIDGMLGTGLKGNLREPLATAVEEINNHRKSSFIVAVDVPSGLDPDSGAVHGNAVRAHVTVTHHLYKKGLLAKGASQFTGKLVLVDIGIPSEAELFVGPGDLRIALKQRSIYSHKGDSGRLLVIAGSKMYTGSAGLCGLAALRTGVDLVTIVAPEFVAKVIQSFSPDLIVRSTPGEQFGTKAIPTVKELVTTVDAVAIGPGLGQGAETATAVRETLSLCRKFRIPAVVDADGIKMLRGRPGVFQGVNVVLTPHSGEFKVLTGKELPAEEVNGWEERSNIVKQWAAELHASILLKGHYDVISDGTRLRVCRGGNPGMTVGGTGDVLTGIVGAFLAKGNGPLEAASAAAFLNKSVGDYVATFKGYHLMASDLVEALPRVLAKYDPSVSWRRFN